MDCTRLIEEKLFPSNGEIDCINYSGKTLIVVLRGYDGQKSFRLTFNDVEGFRVLDEGDLLEFWPTCSATGGSALFEIHGGGWLQQETQRTGFLSVRTKPKIKEYFVTGQNECINVLAWEPPHVERVAL